MIFISKVRDLSEHLSSMYPGEVPHNDIPSSCGRPCSVGLTNSGSSQERQAGSKRPFRDWRDRDQESKTLDTLHKTNSAHHPIARTHPSLSASR